MHNLKDKILDLNITDVLSRYLSLKKEGANHKTCCPFHGEKTPSFVVSAAKGIYKCFGCGEGGNAISFVMKHENLSFIEALKEIAKNHSIQYTEKDKTDEEKKADKERETLHLANKFAADFFTQNLNDKANKLALAYAKKRWKPETIKLFDIGFSVDSWDDFLNHAKNKGAKYQPFIDAGILKEKNNKLFDFFRNRLMFPIHDKYGNIVGFSGRTLGDDKAKYINTQETLVYDKSKTLYGLHMAHRAIKANKYAILVEGNPDVVRMHEIEVSNTVGPCGTALTIDQVNIVKKYADSFTLLFDGDNAGKKAIIKNAKIIIEAGLYCNVITLPDGEDPDSFFKDKSKDDFDDYAKKNLKDFIFYYAEIYKEKAQNPDKRSMLVDDICSMVYKLPESSHDLYIEKLGSIIKPKKLFIDRLKALKKEDRKEVYEERIPEHVKLSEFERLGFYAENNCYFFQTAKGVKEGSNFILEPLFHVPGMHSKRLFKITNYHNHSRMIELDQADLITLSRFRLKVESIGNFIWEAGETELMKLKKYLYQQTLTCELIDQLGWQSHGFFAWSNGIYNGEYKKTDALGIVEHKEKHYYLPAFSEIYEDEKNLFESERKFIHKPGEVSIKEYTKRLSDVFGENAKPAFCYLLASLFRDIIVDEFRFFPMLNLFGFKGSGKTELGESLLHFFGPEQKGINLPNSTEPSIADYISQSRNALALLDEYKNNFAPEKIEFLKGLWKAIGRTRMNMDKDKKKETTAVDTGIIICGQEMPTADIALFSRLVYLTFYKTEFSADEKKSFQELKEIEKGGLAHLTHEILSHRKHFKSKFIDAFNQAANDLRGELDGAIIEERILNNWIVIISSFAALRDVIDTSYNYADIIKNAAIQIQAQNKETKSSSEIQTFWKMVQYLSSDGLIHDQVDYKIKHIDRITTDLVENREFEKPVNVLMIQHARIIPLYRKHGKQMGENILPSDSIEYYLRNDKRFLGKKKSERFVKADPKTGAPVIKDDKEVKKVTTAYCFLYDELNISLEVNKNDDEADEKPF